MISGIHHTGIIVQDLATVRRFYCDLLGLTVVGTIDSVAPPAGNHTGIPGARRRLEFLGVSGDEDGHLIELVQYLEPPASMGHLGKHQLGASHLCFYVDNIQSAYDRLGAEGVRFETAPIVSETPGRATWDRLPSRPRGQLGRVDRRDCSV